MDQHKQHRLPPEKTEFARQLRRNATLPERMLWGAEPIWQNGRKAGYTTSAMKLSPIRAVRMIRMARGSRRSLLLPEGG